MIWPFKNKKKVEKATPKRGGFSAADFNRLTSSLQTDNEHIMRILRHQGRALRARSRQLANNNSYASKFVNMAVSNICGPNPFKLQAKIKSSRGRIDDYANDRVEREWREWGRVGICDFMGRMSWADMQRIITRTIVVDGEALIRVYEGTDFSPWGIQCQLMDTDRLDEDRNEELPGGGAIIAGVEIDKYGRTVAYHFLKNKVQHWMNGHRKEYIRIPSEQIIHIFIPMYAEQLRGVPWMHSAIMKLHQLGAFEEAAVIAARIGASKVGFYRNTGDGATYYPEGSDVDSSGDFVQTAEPGEFAQLPPGWDFQAFDPAYPDSQVGPFMKSCLRGIASGLGVSYHSLGNDLEAVNFSSARAGLLEERDNWMLVQEWLKEHLHVPLYRRWIRMASLTDRVPIQGTLDKYHEVMFQGKRWAWVDPLKDVQANIAALRYGLKSRTETVNEGGGDIEDVLKLIKTEEKLAETLGVEISPDDTKESDYEQEDSTPET